jgi:hypothetical protein
MARVVNSVTASGHVLPRKQRKVFLMLYLFIVLD